MKSKKEVKMTCKNCNKIFDKGQYKQYELCDYCWENLGDEEIVRLAIAKAEAAMKGFDLGQFQYMRLYMKLHEELPEDTIKLKNMPIDRAMIFGLIFSHPFAKSFFGEGPHSFKEKKGISICEKCGEVVDKILHTETCWQHHLQQLVLETDKLRYIKRFL